MCSKALHLRSLGINQFAHYRHSIYKWQQDQRKQAIVRPRSASFSSPSQPANPAFEQLHQPGGFRRNYVIQRANEQGLEDLPVSNNFIEFLYLFGHFVSTEPFGRGKSYVLTTLAGW